MNDALDTDTEGLVEEITRYLAAVDAFRAANCEPTWRPEIAAIAIGCKPGLAEAPFETSAH